MLRAILVLHLVLVALSAQDLSTLPLKLVQRGTTSSVLTLENTTKSPIVAYVILWKEQIKTAQGTHKTEGGAFRDVAIDRDVTPIGPGETKETVTPPAKDAKEIEHNTEFELAAVLFEGGKSAGREPWLTELRERRDLTLKASKGVVAMVSRAEAGSLSLSMLSEELKQFQTELVAGAASAGGKRLGKAFLGDVIAQVQPLQKDADDPQQAATAMRKLKAIRTAEQMRQAKFREAGAQ